MMRLILGAVGTLCLIAVSLPIPALAAELSDVKAVITGSTVEIEVTADIPMTYTYYKVPGQARAVVDIADADPEKVEPLIIVNTGVLSSISVDKIMISDMTVSRLVFNLVSESDVIVKQASDRKKITVSFVNGTSAMVALPQIEAATAPLVVRDPDITDIPSSHSKVEEDPLGLDEPLSIPTPDPVVTRSVKLEPVVPFTPTPLPSKVVVTGVVIGSSFIEIQVNGSVDKIKHVKLTKPDRLSVDIPGMNKMTVKAIPVNKFGISKVRIGSTPGVVRIVLDASRSPFPAYSVVFTENGVRINL